MYLPPGFSPRHPPSAIAMNCLPSTEYVIGVAKAPVGNRYSHTTLPVFLSKARILLSLVAAMNSRPPAVTRGPPYDSVPVTGTPFAARAGYSPSGTRQRYSPVFRSMALSVPQG